MRAPDNHNARVLILAPIGRDAIASAEVLERGGVRTQVCKNVAELTAALQPDALAVLLAEEALFGQDMAALSTWVTDQPAWSDLPFVVLTSQLPNASVVSWRRRLVGSLRNVSLLERPVQAITLATTVQAAVRSRSRQYELRVLLETQKHAALELEHLVVARTQQLEAANAELVRQMAERARVEESLRQAQKMEAIGQLTGGIAHDFNNLLMVILGGLAMFERNANPDRRDMLMHGIRQAAQRGASLTRQLLAFSRRQSLQPQAVDLAAQIGGMRELLERSLGSEVHVELEFANDLWHVRVDPGELELVVLNLVVNARDAMPSGGTITISAANVRPLDHPELQGDYVNLAVADCGAGMSEDVKERAFEPFFTTKEVGKGSGLGLAQVYGFAKQSGGIASITSELGRGTTIALMLPRSIEKPIDIAYDADSGTAEDADRNPSASVLLVEDNEEVAALVSEMLRELGYQVERTADASAALDALTGGSAIDLVFSDIMMPGEIDGVELGRQIRMHRPNMPLLLTSGYAHEAIQRAEQEGFRVLPKPYDLRTLARTLAMVRKDGAARAPVNVG